MSYLRIFLRSRLAHFSNRPFREFGSNSRIFCPQTCPVTHMCKLSRSVTLPLTVHVTHPLCPRLTSSSRLPPHAPLLFVGNHSRTKVRDRVFSFSFFFLSPVLAYTPLFPSAFIVAAPVSRPPVSFRDFLLEGSTSTFFH